MRSRNKYYEWKPILFLFIAVLWAVVFPSGLVRAEGIETTSVTVKFLDAYGQATEIEDLVINEGSRGLLPVAPADPKAPSGTKGKAAWKSSLTGNDFMIGGNYLSYATARSLAQTRQTGNVLYLYGTKACKITFYDNAGTKTFGNPLSAYEGTVISLKQSPTTNPLHKGWSRYKKGTGVWAKFGASHYVIGNQNLYLVTYMRVTYLTQDGKKILSTKEVKRGGLIKLPTPPAETNYRVLGWNIYSNKYYVKYKAGDQYTVEANTRFYVVRKYLPCSVKFLNQDGKSSSAFNKLNIRCLKNESVHLPEVPEINGKVGLGWALKADAEEVKYKADASYKVSKNVTFYAVYKKAREYSVTFVNNKGESNSNFAALNRKIYEGASLKLPSLPGIEGSYSKGWLLTVNGKTKLYTVGTMLRIYDNYTFYACYGAGAKVVLHYNNGDVYKTVTIQKGTSYTLPAMENPSGYTFMGWDKQKNMMISPAAPRKPAYEAGMATPKVSGTMHLYAVLFQRSREGSVTYAQLKKANNGKYSHIIFVGDSRTVRMQSMLLNNMKFSDANISYVASNGQGLSWLQGDGYKRLTKRIGEVNKDPDRKVAVVFNLGVNDLGNYAGYVNYLKKLGTELTQQNCRLFYVSVNPINSVMIRKQGFGSRKENDVRTFNTMIRKGLAGYTYIDIYSWLASTGYSTDRGEDGYNTGVDDGLHYALNTYKRIYLRVVQTICAG